MVEINFKLSKKITISEMELIIFNFMSDGLFLPPRDRSWVSNWAIRANWLRYEVSPSAICQRAKYMCLNLDSLDREILQMKN